jgi:hypothetical protein
MGTDRARIEVPMLHPDHIRYAAGLLNALAHDFERIATVRGTNINKIFDARVAIHMVNQTLEKYARHDIKGVQNKNVWD